MKVGITGASGFIGRHLVAYLHEHGHQSVAFLRDANKRTPPGCAETRPIDPMDLTGLDAVINLAGENIMGRWTAAKKKRVLESRTQTTQRVIDAMSPAGPRTLINASAIGFYGDRGDEEVNETSAPGTGFLSEVTQHWESVAKKGEAKGIRVCRVRIGFVMGKDGGAFKMMRPLFSLGLGGPLGSGRQWMSPAHIDDVVGLMVWLLENPDANGASNATCPHPIRNADFTREMGRALHRPAVLPAPEFALKLALGEMSHLALDSQRVVPSRGGYAFKFPDLPAILKDLVESPR